MILILRSKTLRYSTRCLRDERRLRFPFHSHQELQTRSLLRRLFKGCRLRIIKSIRIHWMRLWLVLGLVRSLRCLWKIILYMQTAMAVILSYRYMINPTTSLLKYGVIWKKNTIKHNNLSFNQHSNLIFCENYTFRVVNSRRKFVIFWGVINKKFEFTSSMPVWSSHWTKGIEIILSDS